MGLDEVAFCECRGYNISHSARRELVPSPLLCLACQDSKKAKEKRKKGSRNRRNRRILFMRRAAVTFAFSTLIILSFNQLQVSFQTISEPDHCDILTTSEATKSCKPNPVHMNKGMGQRLMKNQPDFFKYTTLEDFGYKFNEEGQLRHKETGERFQFEVKEGDRNYNQKHYEALGEVITDHIYELLTTTADLRKILIPLDAKDHEAQGFFFMSQDALYSKQLMILIHGSGVVRAGQWARSLIINDCLESGTMLPYISRARKEGYGILVTNGNQNNIMEHEKYLPIRGSKSPEAHFVYVWEYFIRRAAAKDIVIVAHSYGGVVVVNGMRVCKDAMDHVTAVAFTDSVHSLPHHGADKNLRSWFKKHTRNWVSANDPLDTPISSMYGADDCDMVSAGTAQHVWTSHYARESVFKFFSERLNHKKENKQLKKDKKKVKTTEQEPEHHTEKVVHIQAESSTEIADTEKDFKDDPTAENQGTKMEHIETTEQERKEVTTSSETKAESNSEIADTGKGKDLKDDPTAENQGTKMEHIEATEQERKEVTTSSETKIQAESSTEIADTEKGKDLKVDPTAENEGTKMEHTEATEQESKEVTASEIKAESSTEIADTEKGKDFKDDPTAENQGTKMEHIETTEQERKEVTTSSETKGEETTKAVQEPTFTSPAGEVSEKGDDEEADAEQSMDTSEENESSLAEDSKANSMKTSSETEIKDNLNQKKEVREYEKEGEEMENGREGEEPMDTSDALPQDQPPK